MGKKSTLSNTYSIYSKIALKGQCHKIFCFQGQFPPAPEYPIRTVSNFFQKIAKIFASQGAPPVSTTLAAKLPSVSTTKKYQAADSLKRTWRQKFIYMSPLLPKGDQIKLLKFFWLEIFSICHRVDTVANLELRISPRIFGKNSKRS